jgi:DNA polymerase-3 subunit delta'
MSESAGGWGIIGHEWAVRLLQRSLEREQLSHAYLLLGPSRVGKATLALALARAINCTGDAPPCGVCRSCRLIAAGRHPDVHLVEGGEVRAIHIAQVRELQHQVMLSPVEARRRVVILTDFQGATVEAANCLLKTLEEPPPQVMLVLTASHEGRLLPTIVSRCQILWLRPPASDTIARGLQAQYGAPAEQAAELARLAAGRVGWAVEALQGGELFEQRQAGLDCLAQVLAADTLGRLRLARDLSSDVEGLPALLDLWLGWWRDLLLCRSGCADLACNVDQEAALERSARSYSLPELVAGLQRLDEARRRLERNANPRLTLEVLFLSLGL